MLVFTSGDAVLVSTTHSIGKAKKKDFSYLPFQFVMYSIKIVSILRNWFIHTIETIIFECSVMNDNESFGTLVVWDFLCQFVFASQAILFASIIKCLFMRNSKNIPAITSKCNKSSREKKTRATNKLTKESMHSIKQEFNHSNGKYHIYK